jgi:hypothetical protein
MSQADDGQAAMSARIKLWQEPPQMDAGAPKPSLFFGRSGDLFCAYYVSGARANLAAGSVAILRFSAVLHHRFGYPGDEELHSHPLYKDGLRHYSFHLVEQSPLIAKLEEQNRVHPRHKPGMYTTRFKHFVITFHDETLEVVAREGVAAGSSLLPTDQAVSEFALSTRAS